MEGLCEVMFVEENIARIFNLIDAVVFIFPKIVDSRSPLQITADLCYIGSLGYLRG